MSGLDKPFGDFNYRRAAQKNDHNYGDIISSENLIEEVFEKIDEDHLISGLASYLAQSSVVSGKASGELTKKRARRKASNLVEEGNMSEIKNHVTQAIEGGYIYDFRLEQPWHPKNFFDEDKLTTFPYQHKFIVGYTGKPKHIFFSSEGKEYITNHIRGVNEVKELNNPKSILVQGRLNSGCWVADENGHELKEKAIYFAGVKEANGYPIKSPVAGSKDENGEVVYESNVVLEICIPSNFAIFHSKYERWETVEELKNEFGSPMKLKKDLMRTWTIRDTKEFKIAKKSSQNDGRSFLPIKYITGVWDMEWFDWKKEKSKKPYFLGLKHYINFLYDKYPERMPDPKENNLIIDFEPNPSSQRIKRVEQLESEIRSIRKSVINIAEKHHQLLELTIKIKDRIERAQMNIQRIRKQGEVIESPAEIKQDALESLASHLSNFHKRRNLILREYSKVLGDEPELRDEYSLVKILKTPETSRKIKKKDSVFRTHIDQIEEELNKDLRLAEKGEKANSQEMKDKIKQQFQTTTSEAFLPEISENTVKALTDIYCEELNIDENKVTIDYQDEKNIAINYSP